MQQISLSKKTPRSENEVNQFPLHKGLKFRYFMGYLGLCGLIFTGTVCIYILYKIPDSKLSGGVILGGIIFCLLWLPFISFFFLGSKKYFHLRREAILNGTIIKGKIIQKKPQYRSFLFIIEISKSDKTTTTINYGTQNFLLYNELEINSVHNGLWNETNDFYLFPFEMGIEITPKD